MKRKHRIWRVYCLVLALTMVFFACGGNDNSEEIGEEKDSPKAAELAGLLVDGPLAVNAHGTAYYRATAFYDNGTEKDVTEDVYWSSDSDLAPIGADGILSVGALPGNQKAFISAAYGALSAGLHIALIDSSVSAPVLSGLLINGPLTVYENSQAAYTATAVYSNGHTEDVSLQAAWRTDSDYAAIAAGNLAVYEITVDQAIVISAEFAGHSASFSATLLNVYFADYKLHGFNFSPYTGTQDPNKGAQVSAEQIRERLALIAPYTVWVRTFGSTQGLENTARIAREFGLKTAIGAWLGRNSAANDREMDALIRAALDGYVDLAIVGSEALLRNDLSEAQLIAYIERFRREVPGIPVTTADVYSELIASPALVEACDLIMANYYPYWEGQDIDEALAITHAAHRELSDRYPDKEVMVSEAGWPSAGNTIGAAVPSPENANYHFLNFVSWARAEKVKYFYFEAFDEPWKSAYEGPQGAHWGIFDKDGFLKDGMQAVFDGETIADNWTCAAMPGGAGAPRLELSHIPPVGSNDDLRGRAWHVWPLEHRVAVYIYVNGGWWTKPYFDRPQTMINCSGTWTCDITTGGIDARATRIAAFLIPAEYHPPRAAGGALPGAELEANSLDQVVVLR